MTRVYLDYAAATPLDPQVWDIYKKISLESWANPSGIHQDSQKAKGEIEQARLKISKILNCKAKELFFTGSATEANNIAIQGAIFANKQNGKPKSHLIVSPIEHSSIDQTVKLMQSLDFCDYSVLKIDGGGLIGLESIKSNVSPETDLISIIWVNNEIGTIQPIKEISKLLSEINFERKKNGLNNILFHVDASQAFLYNEIDLEELGVDLLTLSSHKIYAPRGAALLYVKEGVKLSPIQGGGAQESGLRSGTQNTAAIVAFSEAIAIFHKDRDQNINKIKTIQDYTIQKLFEKNKNRKSNLYNSIIINGITGNHRSVNNINFSLKNIDHQTLHTALDLAGFSLSGGSSCNSGSLEISSVIQSIRSAQNLFIPDVEATIRLSLGKENTTDDIDLFFQKLEQIVAGLKASAI